MTEMIANWRSEIETDLSDACAQLIAEEEALAAAEIGATAAKRERHELTEALNRLHHNVQIASSLAMRVRFHEDTLRQADGRLVQARNALKVSHARIADLRAALAQIEVIAPPAPIDTPISVLED